MPGVEGEERATTTDTDSDNGCWGPFQMYGSVQEFE